MLEHTRRAALLAAAVLGAVAVTAAPPAGGGRPVPFGLERLKALAGDWVAAEDGEMAKKGDLVSRYAVAASGSAVVETVFPGTPHEMVTVYHADGPDLVPGRGGTR